MATPHQKLGELNGLWLWLIKIVVSTYIPMVIAGYILFDRRLTTIEANRFTSMDGRDVWNAIAARPTRDEVPPPVVVQRLNRIDEDIRKIDEKLDRMMEITP